MTKHRPEQSLPAPPAPSRRHLGEQRDHHLDFHWRDEPRSSASSGVARSSAGPRWCRRSVQMAPQQPENKPARSDAHTKQPSPSRDAWSGEGEKSSGGRKKNYQRYPKPPYSYLAMIAMVIQRSPDKKLTLSEILKEISTLFPFFKGNYKGWRDSVRHNLSSYDCFVKVLKDPSKPQGKGNFWTVDLSRVPLELLKRQNTAVSRQDETIFAQDLAPYILQGYTPESEPPASSATSLSPAQPADLPLPQGDPFRPKLELSFAIDSLLHSLRPANASGDGDVAVGDCWGEEERPRYTSSALSASASSVSPASSSSSSDEEWKAVRHSAKRLPPSYEPTSEACEGHRPPLQKSSRRETFAPPWELPTSYSKYPPPNAVAPPSMRFNGAPLLPLHGGLPLYGYSGSPLAPGHFLGHPYWPLLPSRQVSVQAPPLIVDLDHMLQSAPPNKSVFDALLPTSQNAYVHPQAKGLYGLQNGAPLNRYHQF
ncbi:forkhead box protein H1 [Austrofundulus limnaeus]|uniref:Forkhead box protein H1 n=1 Tax=Austrofundulus limnaeus TaxID=52670 RepID=A0A2I4C2J2_AUSLI|nr:PREDICTED: forkhead box protein H1 [Austrofundulus limnaeus]XP_013874212.1 PREDICTED: forkhead box protein H1 [Austrofundulus limnaeus]